MVLFSQRRPPEMPDQSRAVLLAQGLEQRLSPSTLKVYLAAIAVNHDPVEGKSVGKHDWVVRFLRGARRLNPPRPPSIPSLDLSLVLRALQQGPFEPLQTVEPKFLSMKTLLLLALASIKRVGDLHAGGEPASAAPGGGRPSPGFALSRPSIETLRWQDAKLQDLRPALCLSRRPAERECRLQAEDGPLDSGCHHPGLSGTGCALPVQVESSLYEKCSVLLGAGSWCLADRYL